MPGRGCVVFARTHAHKHTRTHEDGTAMGSRRQQGTTTLTVDYTVSLPQAHNSRPQITTASPGTLHGKRGWGSGSHSRSTSGCAVVWFIFRPNKSGADRHDETGTADSPGPGPCLAPSPAVSNASMPRCFAQGTLPLARLTAELPRATRNHSQPPPQQQQQQQWTGLDRCIGCRPRPTLPVRRAVRGKRRDDYREPRPKWSFAQLVLVGCDG